MRLKKIKNADIIVSNSKYTINNPNEYIGKWNTSVFENDNPIHIEIGSGRGQFIIKMAELNPNINFVGIEMQDSALVKAVKKLEKFDMPIKNLRIICVNAINLNEIFNREISCIYLNFSDPWPKKRHTKRRLTSPLFLKVYDDLFKNTKVIIQKTDNNDLFEYSLDSLSEYGYTLNDVSRDYDSDTNIMTEYEEKFRKNGVSINYCKYVKE